MWIVLLCAATGLVSADAQDGHPHHEWQFELTPYVWAAGLDGHIRPSANLPGVGVKRSFTDLISDIDGALFLTGSARKGNWLLLGDLTWSSSSREGSAQLPVAPVSISARAGLDQFSVTLAGGRTLARNEHARLDVFAGVRMWQVEADAEVPALNVSVSARSPWADPLVGARFNVAPAQKVSFTAHVDFGGAGIFSGAESTLHLLAVANWNLGERAYLTAGYRHLSVDYRQGGRTLDFALTGPVLGATWRF